MKLNINHYYNIRGWNVHIDNSSPSSQEIKTIHKSPLSILDLSSPPIQDISTIESTDKFSI